MHTWEKDHVFALLHDATNCIRIGDLTKFRSDRADLVEVKTDPSSLGREQIARMERVVAVINDGAPLVIDGQRVELHKTSQQYRTRLPELGRAIGRARREGVATVRLGTGWVATVSSLMADAHTDAQAVERTIQRSTELRRWPLPRLVSTGVSAFWKEGASIA